MKLTSKIKKFFAIGLATILASSIPAISTSCGEIPYPDLAIQYITYGVTNDFGNIFLSDENATGKGYFRVYGKYADDKLDNDYDLEIDYNGQQDVDWKENFTFIFKKNDSNPYWSLYFNNPSPEFKPDSKQKISFKFYLSLTIDNPDDLDKPTIIKSNILTFNATINPSTNVVPYSVFDVSTDGIINGFKDDKFPDKYKISQFDTLEIPAEVKKIAQGAFKGSGDFTFSENIKKLSFEEECKIDEIGNDAFNHNTSLTDVDFTNCTNKSLSITQESFAYISTLNYVIFPANLGYIGERAFTEDSALRQIDWSGLTIDGPREIFNKSNQFAFKNINQNGKIRATNSHYTSKELLNFFKQYYPEAFEHWTFEEA